MKNTNYKLSSYNHFSNYEEKVICYNAIKDTLIVLKKDEYKKFFNEILTTDNFSEKFPSLFDQTMDWGFIVPIERNEKEVLLLKNKERIFLDNSYRLTINPTLECNFSCWYCSVDVASAEARVGYMNKDTVDRINLFIEKTFKNNTNNVLHLDWFGGEPLLYFDEVVYPISKKAINILDSRDFRNQITTNGFLITDELINKFIEIELKYFQITLDGDEKRHNKIRYEKENKSSYQTIINNIKKICTRIDDSKVVVRINYDKKTLYDIGDIFDEFEDIPKERLQFDFQRVWQIKSDDELSELLKKTIKKCQDKGFLTSSYGLKSKLEFTCYADKYNYTVINFDGSLYGCTARDYSEKHKLGVITENGDIDKNIDKQSVKYSKATFDNEFCLACKFLGLCFGPCTQKMIEYRNNEIEFSNICMLNNTEVDIDSFLVFEAKNRKLLLETIET